MNPSISVKKETLWEHQNEKKTLKFQKEKEKQLFIFLSRMKPLDKKKKQVKKTEVMKPFVFNFFKTT